MGSIAHSRRSRSPENILSSPLTGYTYKLPPRAVGPIQELAEDNGSIAAHAHYVGNPRIVLGISHVSRP